MVVSSSRSSRSRYPLWAPRAALLAANNRPQGDSDRVTAAWSKWWNRYLDGVVGIKDPSKDFHSFRHLFKLAARECGIPEDQHDALIGHANASVSRAYGGSEGYPLGPLAKSIRNLRYTGLKFPKAER